MTLAFSIVGCVCALLCSVGIALAGVGSFFDKVTRWLHERKLRHGISARKEFGIKLVHAASWYEAIPDADMLVHIIGSHLRDWGDFSELNVRQEWEKKRAVSEKC